MVHWRSGDGGAGRRFELSTVRCLTAPGFSGKYAGTISGGCLEAEVVRKSLWLIRESAPRRCSAIRQRCCLMRVWCGG
ncbi:XdhC family protein [Granulicella sp. L60]|uniref:XdhC family protein n=1 Tax=Granulicella sp. L60 TaxID=1641866 RepID=UPI0020B11C66|nr:XdhC family protein [Granulicella sp. L60]